MRISGGDARGIRLRVPEGSRPASERVRQAIFSSLAAEIPGANVLDLYCGSGAYGLEALSRGADSALFVDKAPAAVEAVRDNAKLAGLSDRCTVRRADVLTFLLKHTKNRDRVDLVFIDPPYSTPDVQTTLLDASKKAVANGGLVVIERRFRSEALEPQRGYMMEADRRYGDTQVLVFRRQSSST